MARTKKQQPAPPPPHKVVDGVEMPLDAEDLEQMEADRVRRLAEESEEKTE